MGNFYTNYTLRGPSQQDVARALNGRTAFVTSEQEGCVVVFDEQSEGASQDVITELATRLSSEFSCPVLAVINHDDDILWYQLYLSGELADEYNSSPNYFEDSADLSAPAGGDAEKLCRAFGSIHVKEIENTLRKSQLGERGYVFAVERHADLARILGISPCGVGAGYSYLADGELPNCLDEEDLVRVT